MVIVTGLGTEFGMSTQTRLLSALTAVPETVFKKKHFVPGLMLVRLADVAVPAGWKVCLVNVPVRLEPIQIS
jgi:hypothetical protein